MILKKLALPALVITPRLTWLPQTLGTGSIVEIVADPSNERSGLDLPGEILVNWIDIVGRVTPGWLARTTTFTTFNKGRELRNERGDLTLSPYDALRDKFALDARVNAPWSVLGWLARFGEQEIETLQRVIRQLGGTLPLSGTPNDIIVRAARLITQQEVIMDEIQEAGSTATKPARKRVAKKAATKSSAKKAPAKKASAKRAISAEAPARSMARTVGQTLLPLLEKAGAKRDGISIAKHLANDESVTKKQLHELRDAVNELAGTARENNKESLASSLSGANRLVRRLARKA
jgi:hypothetical protein